MATATSNRKAKILYDGQCPLCLKSVAGLKRLDWLKVCEFANARESQVLADLQVDVSPERLLEEMHLLTPKNQKVLHGFAAFRWLSWRLPACWLIAPFLYLPGVPWLGQKLYLWVARNRFRLVPCHGGVCTLPQKDRS